MNIILLKPFNIANVAISDWFVLGMLPKGEMEDFLKTALLVIRWSFSPSSLASPLITFYLWESIPHVVFPQYSLDCGWGHNPNQGVGDTP